MLLSYGPGDTGRDIRAQVERLLDNYTYDVGTTTFTAAASYMTLTASHKSYTRDVVTSNWVDGFYRVRYYDFFSSTFNTLKVEDVSILDGEFTPLGTHKATYHADISFIDKSGAAEGLYLVTFFKNAKKIANASINTPTITVRDSVGNTLINAAALTHITGTDTYKYSSSGAAYQIAGDLYAVTVNANYVAGTISTGSVEIPISYTWNIGRDV